MTSLHMAFWLLCAPCPSPKLSWITKDTLPVGTYTVQIQSVMSGGASQCLYGWPSGNGMFAHRCCPSAANAMLVADLRG